MKLPSAGGQVKTAQDGNIVFIPIILILIKFCIDALFPLI